MSEQTRQTMVRIKRVDDEERIVYGEVYAPYQLDTYGDFMLPDDIKKMAHRFMRLDLSKVIDTQHDETPNGCYPVESFIAREGDPDYTAGAWVLGVKVPEDELWTRVKSGELNAYSFQSLVTAIEVDVEYLVVRDHVGSTENNSNHQHVYFVQVDDDGNVTGGRTSVENGHFHEITRASVTEAADDHTHRFFL